MTNVLLWVTYAELIAIAQGSPDPTAREAAVQVLGRDGHTGAADLLMDRLREDSNKWVRARSARSLGRLDVQQARPTLRNQLERERDDAQRVWLAGALCELGDRAGEVELLRLLRTGTHYVKAMALERLVETSGQPLGDSAAAWQQWFAKSGPRAPGRRTIDLTHTLESSSPVFPGGVNLKPTPLASYDQGYFAQKLEIGEHTGTHMDAPAHFVKGARTVDGVAPEHLRGPLVVLDVRYQVKRNSDYQVGPADLEHWEKKHGPIPDGALVVAFTGWHSRWPDIARYQNKDSKGTMRFPGFSKSAVARLLARNPSFVGLGIDTLSIDHGRSIDFAAHHALLGASKYALENLTNLDQLPARGAHVFVGPMKIAGGSGAPARVLAEVP